MHDESTSSAKQQSFVWNHFLSFLLAHTPNLYSFYLLYSVVECCYFYSGIYSLYNNTQLFTRTNSFILVFILYALLYVLKMSYEWLLDGYLFSILCSYKVMKYYVSSSPIQQSQGCLNDYSFFVTERLAVFQNMSLYVYVRRKWSIKTGYPKR